MKNAGDVTTKYVPYDKQDARYGGAGELIDQELSLLEKKRNSEDNDTNVDRHNLKGIALSGGGIRSASFCLGVLQVLAHENKLKHFEYLSTVSGGGYIGGSLSWLWSGIWKQKKPHNEKRPCTREFGTGSDDFPYGCGERNSDAHDPDMNRDQASMMRHLRQHGEYLVPGKGIGHLSFLSVVLRSITMGFVTMTVLASGVFHALHLTPAFDDSQIAGSYTMFAAIVLCAVYAVLLLCYGLLAIRYRGKATMRAAYVWRRRWERWIKWPLVVTLSLLFVGTAQSLSALIETYAAGAGGSAALAGSLIAWFSQRSKLAGFISIIPRALVVYAGVLLMFLGLAVLSDQLALWVIGLNSTGSIDVRMLLLGAHIVAMMLILVLACLTPINKVSIHRYYRDRLMETFMPDACDVLDQGDSFVATAANETGVHELGDTLTASVPYHIINANIVLVRSEIAKFRGRGGDNFILSPCFSGSNATGWRETKTFAGGSITLPTAVAISGAAANPDAGVAGKGITINPFLSTLMSIFNLRLGYWCVNPNPDCQPNQNKNPNYLVPGFWGILGRRNINETSAFVQLSDGGHFENLAMYELLRRHCKLIVCCDGEKDRDFTFESLANVMEKARVDFGIEIDLDADDLKKLEYSVDEHGELRYATSAYLIADIHYPDANEASGKLVYIKTTLPHDLPGDVVSYKRQHPDFPDETTADQFFDETQLESYRMLGMHIAKAVVADGTILW
jgi:hypothetical protein